MITNISVNILYINTVIQELDMREIINNDIKIEQAEFINRLMIDAELSNNDVKIGLCLLYELLSLIKNNNDSKND